MFQGLILLLLSQEDTPTCLQFIFVYKSRLLVIAQSLPTIDYRVENLYRVVCLYVSPGFKMVLGNDGWFGLSGKCCVSRQSAPCFTYFCPPFVLVNVPSRKLPE